jgi:CRP/FNR family transcriptional regulator, cyclic AMP receptor protein
MRSILDHCAGAEELSCDAGAVLLAEGEKSGRLIVLVEGAVEVVRGNTQVAVMNEPGSVFGEMSVFLDAPHTATVRAISPVRARVFRNADAFLRLHPEIVYFIAKTLARRLNAATTYLVDIKRQFEGQSNHLGMLGEVLESLIHQQESEFTPGSDRRDDPRM